MTVRIISLITTLMSGAPVWAKDFSTSASMHHMTMRGPESLFDYFIIIGGTLTVILVAIFTIRLFINPREQGADHIKRRVLQDDFSSHDF